MMGCALEPFSSHYPLQWEEFNHFQKTIVYAPPHGFDYNVNIYEHRGRYCIGWNGASRFFEYPPTGAAPEGNELAVTLCLGGNKRVTYRLVAVGQSLEFVD